MKTLQELYNEVIQSDELKKEFLEAGKNGKVEEFIKNHGCDVTLDEIKDFLENLTKEDKELSVDELGNVAGGCGGEIKLKPDCPNCNSNTEVWFHPTDVYGGYYYCSRCNIKINR